MCTCTSSSRPTLYLSLFLALATLQAALTGYQIAAVFLADRHLKDAREAYDLAQTNMLASADLLADARARLAAVQKETQR